MTPVKNQGKHGTCVAMATIGALEVKVKLYNNDPLSNPDLSEWYIVHNTNNLNGLWEDADALKELQRNGTVEESLCPYSAIPNFTPPPPDSTLYKITDYNPAVGVTAMKEALMTKGPVIAGMIDDSGSLYHDAGTIPKTGGTVPFSVTVKSRNGTIRVSAGVGGANPDSSYLYTGGQIY